MIHFEHPAVCGIRAANVTSTKQLAGVTCPACRNIAGTLARTQGNQATRVTKDAIQAMGFTTDQAPVQVQLVPAPIHTLPVEEPPMQISTQIPANTTKTRKTPKRKTGKK